MKKLLPGLLILLVGLAFWIPARWQLLETRRALQDAQARLVAWRGRLAQNQSALECGRRKKDEQDVARVKIVAEAARAKMALLKIDPDTQWANPPASLPDWDPQSPYIWVRKDLLPKLDKPAFDEAGGLSREAASVLAVDEPARQKLNEQLKKALADYQAGQAARAQVSDQPFDGSKADGSTVSVQIPAMPEEGKAFREQFNDILQENLGSMRASLIDDASESWLDKVSGEQAASYCVVVHPNGNCRFSKAWSGNSSMSDGIPVRLVRYEIPGFLMSYFNDVLYQPSEDQ